jgi:hypothetical protein
VNHEFEVDESDTFPLHCFQFSIFSTKSKSGNLLKEKLSNIKQFCEFQKK